MSRIFILVLSIAVAACSSSSETEKDTGESSQEVYVFDDVAEDSLTTPETPETEAPAQTPVQPAVQAPVQETVEEPEPPAMNNTVDFYLVQVGAFTTETRARNFINQNKDKIGYEMNVHYSEEIRLYVVQLQPFRTRKKAEEVRNELWNTGVFNDAFIVPK